MASKQVNGKQRHVLVRVPPAVRGLPSGGPFEPPTAEDLVALQSVRLSELEAELDALRITCNTITNVACALVQERLDRGDRGAADDAVLIPKELSDRMEGARIQIREERQGVAVRINERQAFPVEPGV